MSGGNVRALFMPASGGHFEMALPERLRVVQMHRLWPDDSWEAFANPDHAVSRNLEQVSYVFSGWLEDGRALYAEDAPKQEERPDAH